LDTAGESGGSCVRNIDNPVNFSVLKSYRSPSLAMRPHACTEMVPSLSLSHCPLFLKSQITHKIDCRNRHHLQSIASPAEIYLLSSVKLTSIITVNVQTIILHKLNFQKCNLVVQKTFEFNIRMKPMTTDCELKHTETWQYTLTVSFRQSNTCRVALTTRGLISSNPGYQRRVYENERTLM